MRYFLSAYPAVRLLACAVAGIMAAIFLPVAPIAWFAVAIASCIMTALLLFVSRKRHPVGTVSLFSAACYLMAVFSVFAFHASASYRLTSSPSLLSWVGRDVILSGIVDGRPVDRNDLVTMRLRVSEVFDDGRTTTVSDRAKVVVRMPGDEEMRFQEGDFVRAKGRLALIPVAANRGEYDPRFQNRLKGIHVQIFCAGPWQVLREPPKPGFSVVQSIVNPVRNYLNSAIDRNFPEGGARYFIKGMVLGERELMPEELYEAFRRTGTAHVLAVSGLHVALLAYAVNLCLQRLKVTEAGRWLSLFIIVAVIGLYSFVTGNAPSIKRASVMTAVIIAGGTIGRKSYPVNSLAVADLLILLFDPFDLLTPGFLMTNGAVLGILTIYPRLSGIVPDGKGVLQRFGHWLWSAFSVSLSAMIGVSPVIAWYFGTFSPSGIAANLPVVLFSTLAMYASFPMFLFHGFASGIASLFGAASWFFARLALSCAELFSRLPLASVEVRPGVLDVAVFYLTFAFAFYALVKRTWGRLAVFVLVGMNVLLWNQVLRPVQTPPQVVTVNVGREVAVLFSAGGQTCLVDAGRREGSWERIRQQASVWNLATPVSVASLFSPGSVIQSLPVSPFPTASGAAPHRSFVIRMLDAKVLRIDSKTHSLLLVSGLKRLEKQRADGADVVFWVYRFTGKEWHRLDAWIAETRPRRMLLVPGPFMTAAQRELLNRYAASRQQVEVRSRSRQTVWY
ncbi:ComEC family competence protein [Chlorobaculum sp. MV4-Y]|uniref:ComEC/Rec2 family competence protein n=1 Tax=Chlorobaculum sp. MV4-Y TaxID=2976335 RepID=UPI0021AE66F9|nr:ComEC/Rec2 family competence protein [Chlorobaculum sp. MV4-Y]UWX58265.1 ComEC family competence protein [Chlorobaculum sp. MV4-Y]